MKINQKHKDKDYQKVATDILTNSKYDGSSILICWHHGEILKLAAALGAKGLPPSSHWPGTKWPGQVFGWVLQLCYDGKGKIVPAQTVCINQKLMYDDHGL